ncbi:alpha/beta fold hydrolase [Nocardia sp. CDC160]|uniref:alpha/beta fold hydrolase n=1 Tax=Nocardia sp. CDC160 TaxID=3112166 RepID=UPI002DB8AA2E|nr:alpha/beta hydrolase [Nocardia sp. CDC160]MEC3918151.1 alpha/beta hydrolase [Nocardia sp. CDC160]
MKGRPMAKISKFRSEAAREEFLRLYAGFEDRWPIPSTTFEVPGAYGRTFVRRSGSGTRTPVVLLHSYGANGLYWHRRIEEFTRDRVVYTPDTLGTAGRSVQTAPISGEADLTAWVRELLTALDHDRVHLIGYSHGAWHAILAALAQPEHLASVTLVEPGGVFNKPLWRTLFTMMRFGLGGRSDENMRKLNEWFTPGVTFSDEEWAIAKAAIMGFQMRIGWARVLKDAELQSISTPTLGIFGGESLASRDPEGAARRLAKQIPNSEVEVYPGIGHAILDQIPEQVVPRILDFLDQHEPAELHRAT